MRRKRWWFLAVMFAGLVAVAIAGLTWPSSPAAPGADRVRQYAADLRACLLTGATGVSDPLAGAAWAGLQSASESNRAMVSYLPVPGAMSPASVQPYLASLVQRQCGVIVAVGAAQSAAASSAAARFRQVRFIAVTSNPVSSSVLRISPVPAAHVPASVEAAVSAALLRQAQHG
jgi:basic membrane lipoprotein Med (substrate-binding protein (PBP1-ABC) superfamily)